MSITKPKIISAALPLHRCPDHSGARREVGPGLKVTRINIEQSPSVVAVLGDLDSEEVRNDIRRVPGQSGIADSDHIGGNLDPRVGNPQDISGESVDFST